MRLFSILALSTLLLAVSCSDSERSAPRVVANGEDLLGTWDSDESRSDARRIAVFRGIPFAAPPVGDLRWRAPQPNTPRRGLQAATGFAPACMQGPHITNWYASVAEDFGFGPDAVGRPNGVSEDCLYLNLWSPRLDSAARLPVMVWVHGGSNKGGWSYEPNYIGARLAARGVVVVSIAYRLGPFGFFSHPALDNGAGQPVANFGWLDAYMAFRWVAENIAAFGGDPENITAMGESSGAGDISDWVAAEMGEDRLYRRAIAQSPGVSLHNRRTLADEQALGRRLVDSLGIEGELTAERIREIPAKDLLAAAEMELSGHYFDAVIDGLTMKERPIESLNRSDMAGVDILIGTNADESYMYVNENASRVDLEKWVKETAPEQAQALLAEVRGEADIRRAFARLQTASDFLCPSRYFASRVSELGGRSWVYYFTRQRPGRGGEKMGAYHGAEIPYVFDMHDDWLPTQSVDHAVTGAVMDYWVQFARSGDPNLPDRPEWPLYTAENPMVMELGDRIGAMAAHDQALCDLLEPVRPNLAGEQK